MGTPAINVLLIILLIGLIQADDDFYLKPQYTAEGEHLLEHLKYHDVLEEEQVNLPPTKTHTVFKIITEDFNEVHRHLSNNKTHVEEKINENIKSVMPAVAKILELR